MSCERLCAFKKVVFFDFRIAETRTILEQRKTDLCMSEFLMCPPHRESQANSCKHTAYGDGAYACAHQFLTARVAHLSTDMQCQCNISFGYVVAPYPPSGLSIWMPMHCYAHQGMRSPLTRIPYKGLLLRTMVHICRCLA